MSYLSIARDSGMRGARRRCDRLSWGANELLPTSSPWEVAIPVKNKGARRIDKPTAEEQPDPTETLRTFQLSDDLRGPIDDLQRLRDAEVKTREIIQKYQAAMREMMVRFEILDQDLNLKKHRNPIHHVESRIKKPASIFEKLERYGKEPTLENLERYIMDVAGVRVICSYIHDVYNLLELLQKQDDLQIVEIKDYIANPKPNGYRSLHVIVRIPVYFLDKKEHIPVEVQLRTIAMDFWASLEHDLKYKSVSEVQGIDSYDELKDCSRIIEDVEARMQILARALEMGDERL